MGMTDVVATVWVLTIFGVLFIWLPATRLLSNWDRVTCRHVARGFARITLTTVVAAWALSRLQLFNALTLIAVYAGWAVLLWTMRHRRSSAAVARQRLRHTAFKAASLCEQGGDWRGRLTSTSARRLTERMSAGVGAWWGTLQLTPDVVMMWLLVSIAVAVTLLLRFIWPLGQMRLGHPEGYQALLATQAILAGQPIVAGPPAFPAVAATLSIFSAAAPIQIVRLLGPVVGCLLVAAVAYCIGLLTKNNAAALAGTFALGLYVFSSGAFAADWPIGAAELGRAFNDALTRQWAGASVEFGALFVVISAIVWHDAKNSGRRAAWSDGFACMALVACAEPRLLPAAFLAASVAFAPPLTALLCFSIGWVLMGIGSLGLGTVMGPPFVSTLPIALALSIGALFHLATRALDGVTRLRLEPIALLLVAVLSVLAMPGRVDGQYLEYDVAARKTLEIANSFPRQRWLIVAPVEALAQTYGRGGYEDLQQFVDRYSAKAGDPRFTFPFSVDHVFIFVEKHPFVTFAKEPIEVPFDVLTDPAYRYYRAAAGRASVEYSAYELCERYRHAHADASIYYEDDVLKIYHFALPAAG